MSTSDIRVSQLGYVIMLCADVTSTGRTSSLKAGLTAANVAMVPHFISPEGKGGLDHTQGGMNIPFNLFLF